MKRRAIYSILAALMLALWSCNSEPAVLDLKIDLASTDVQAGEAVVFTISGNADFITFYSGEEGNNWSDYPNANSRNVVYGGEEITYEYIYTNLNETINATFVASSYGDWSEDVQMEVFDFDISVTDDRTGIIDFSVKTGGLFGSEFAGIINEETSTISVNVTTGTPLTAMTTFITTESTIAEIWKDGARWENKSAVDYSSGSVVFEIRSAAGPTAEWTVIVSEI